MGVALTLRDPGALRFCHAPTITLYWIPGLNQHFVWKEARIWPSFQSYALPPDHMLYKPARIGILCNHGGRASTIDPEISEPVLAVVEVQMPSRYRPGSVACVQDLIHFEPHKIKKLSFQSWRSVTMGCDFLGKIDFFAL